MTPVLPTQWHRALLSSLSTPEEGKNVLLERLLVSMVDPINLRYLPLLPRLQTLQVSPWQQKKEELVEMVDFYRGLAHTPLPLRHLHLNDQSSVGDRAPWSSKLFTALPSLIRAHAGQLVTLELLHSYLNVSAKAFEPPPMETAQLITAGSQAKLGFGRYRLRFSQYGLRFSHWRLRSVSLY